MKKTIWPYEEYKIRYELKDITLLGWDRFSISYMLILKNDEQILHNTD